MPATQPTSKTTTKPAAHTPEAIVTYERVNSALDGNVLVDIGHVTEVERRFLKRAVRAGKLVSWRGKWFPVAGAPWGIGPDKTCWSTPEVAAHWQSAREGLAKAEGR